MDVKATTAVRQAEVTARRVMLDRTEQRFGIWPERLAADTGYGSAENLAWLVHEKGHRTSRSSTNRCATLVASAAATLSMITPTTAIPAQAASRSRDIGRRAARLRSSLPATASTNTVPAKPTVTSAISDHAAALAMGAEAAPLDPRRSPRSRSRSLADRRLSDLQARAEEGRDAVRMGKISRLISVDRPRRFAPQLCWRV